MIHSGVLYHHELPDPMGCAILEELKEHFSPMLVTSFDSDLSDAQRALCQNYPTQEVFDFFTKLYHIDSVVEVYHKDLTDENAFGFTQVNGDQQEIEIHYDLNEKDYIITLMHELVHVVQNENGMDDDEERENEAYSLESILFNQFTAAN